MRLGQACLALTRRVDFGRLILTQLRGRIINQTGPILTGAQDPPVLCGRLVGQLPDVLRMLAREALTGQPPPPSATRMVDLWRPMLEPKIAQAGGRLAALGLEETLVAARPELMAVPQEWARSADNALKGPGPMI